MKSYLHDFFETFSYPEEARQVLMQAYLRLEEKEEYHMAFQRLLERYAENMCCDFELLLKEMKELSVCAGIHEYTGSLLLCICLSEKLKEYYKEEGISEQIWFDSMCDLKWKLMECKCVYNIWGSFVAWWFDRFYDLSRFAIGKLQFETIPFKKYYKKNDVELTPESIVINVHIPRTGTKLDRESQQKAYREAVEFFGARYQLEQIVFVCESWLLFPKNKEILSSASNLYAFISEFDMIEFGEFDDYKEVWRLFDTQYNGDAELLPQDTSFRRAYAEWIRKGEKTGWGYGVKVFR